MTIQHKSKSPTSVTLSLRLDPRSKYLIDLLGREQKRGLTAVIERSVERAAADTFLMSEGGEGISFLAMVDQIWSTDEPTRLCNLARLRADLLTVDEMRIWETVKISPGFWQEGRLQLGLVQAHWDALLVQIERRQYLPNNKPFDLPG